MATDKTTTKESTSAATEAPQAAQAPQLGSRLRVKPAPGLLLVNNETGAHFAPDGSEVIVTVTTLRRLADGDLLPA